MREKQECGVNVNAQCTIQLHQAPLIILRAAPYVAEVVLVHLDLSDIGGVIGCVDLVLLLVVQLTIQTLRKRVRNMSLFHQIRVK